MMSEFTFIIQILQLVLVVSTLPGCLGWLEKKERSEKRKEKKKSVRFLESDESLDRSRTDSIKPPTPDVPDSSRRDGGGEAMEKREAMKKEILEEMDKKNAERGVKAVKKERMIGTKQESLRMLKKKKKEPVMDEIIDRVEEERKRLTKVVEKLEERWAREDLEDLEESTDELSVLDRSPPTVGEDGFYEDSFAEDPTYLELMGKQTGWLKNWERRVLEKEEGDELKIIKDEVAANEKIGRLVKMVDEKKRKEKKEKAMETEKKASEKVVRSQKASPKLKASPKKTAEKTRMEEETRRLKKKSSEKK